VCCTSTARELRLVKTAPQIGNARLLFPSDTTQQPEPHRVATDFELLGTLIDKLFGTAVGFVQLVRGDVHIYSVL
jgi:hypothetical protein